MLKSIVRHVTTLLIALACVIVPAGDSFAPPLTEAQMPTYEWAPGDEDVLKALRDPWHVQPLPGVLIDSETLWLARVMYSESKRAEEQELVGWVARNRAETAFRGGRTIEAVATAPYQFTALSVSSIKKRYYFSLTPESQDPGWQRTLALAYYVRMAADSLRPFPVTTRHFLSQRSLASPDSLPEWSYGQHTIVPRRPIELDERRFRFYAGIL